MNLVKNYLRLPAAYCAHLKGVRWSSSDDALVCADGTTFAFNEEVAQFLEGFASGEKAIHFPHLLHLLDLLRAERLAFDPQAERLRLLFARAGRPLRNAGALAAVLCRDLPPFAQRISLQDVCDRLRNVAMPIRWFVATYHDLILPAEQPPLSPKEFEEWISAQVRAYSNEELLSWFRDGRGPIRKPGEALAREVPPPRTLEGALAALLERPRLAPAQGFVSQLVGALTLPPRRLQRLELPLGGYSDVTTRGNLDQILPSQFALDELDFLRRLAEQELLYFRREEPPSHARHELAVLLDQGVRTWGDVRLVLAAAVLALGRQAVRRRRPLLVATTSNDGVLVEPLQVDGEALGELVESSDLSPNPGLALERVLEQPAEGARDVVLLTHPRSLAEADVQCAARKAGPAVRLFAVAMDAHGAAELSELRHGAPVSLRRFRIDFTRSVVPARPVGSYAGAPSGPWQGDVEPIPFPFRFGLAGGIRFGCFAFEHGGDWLLAAASEGLLYAWKADGSQAEILPRGLVDGAAFTRVDAVTGVLGGFVVTGRIGERLVVLHYDWRTRTCTRYLPDVQIPYKWPVSCSPAHHAVVLYAHSGGFGCSLDLATGSWHYSLNPGPPNRAREAWEAWVRGEVAGGGIWVTHEEIHGHEHLAPTCYLNSRTGLLDVHNVSPQWNAFIPLSDGRPALKGCRIVEAQFRQNVLAVVCTRPEGEAGFVLRLFRGPDGTLLGEYPLPRHEHGFVLSADARWLACKTKPSRLLVRPVAGDGPPFLTPSGGFSGETSFVLGVGYLRLRTGRHHAHTLRWTDDKLEVQHQKGEPVVDTFASPPAGLPPPFHYDRERFIEGDTLVLQVACDRYGQVAVCDLDGKLICMFFAFREALAGWMPDGTRFGPEKLTGGPETPRALERFGQALCAAERLRRGPS